MACRDQANDGAEVESILVNKTKVGQASRQVWSGNFDLPNELRACVLLRDRLRVIVGTYPPQRRPRRDFLSPLTSINAQRAPVSDISARRSPNKAAEGSS